MNRREFEDKYFAKPSKESIEKYERAFNARLAYEKNCIAKYDYPDFMHLPSRPPKKGETMRDFAMKYNTTIEEMKDCELQVDRALENESTTVCTHCYGTGKDHGDESMKTDCPSCKTIRLD